MLVALLALMAADTRTSAWPIHGVVQNEDCTNFFYYHEIAPGIDGGAAVDTYVDRLAEAGVAVVLWNTNARRTNYRSGVWDTFWDGWDPAGGDDQPFLKPFPPGEVVPFRKMIARMRALHDQGVDYPARAAARCRQRGISPWISLRMNDVRYNDVLNHPFHGRFWVEHPEFFRKGASGYFANALDYAHPEVRDLYRRLIEETLARYDVDGLELDFMREPYVFSPGKEAPGAPVLTEWLRAIRKMAREAAARRGHPVRLGVRVPSRPETAKALGLDALQWAKEDLVDLVVPTPRWSTLEFDMPMAEWRRLLRPFPGVMLAGGLEILYRPHAGAAAGALHPEHAFAAAASVLHGGADAVYLFNYFQDGTWPRETYRQTLSTMASLERLADAPRWHAVTYRDIIAPGEEYRAPLPAVGAEVRFDLPVCPEPKPGWQAQVVLGIEGGAGTPPAVRVNGHVCEQGSVAQEKTGALVTCAVPAAALAGRERAAIVATAAAGQTLRVVRVELRVQPGGAK